jgi:hypothetical protein
MARVLIASRNASGEPAGLVVARGVAAVCVN